MNKSLRYLHHPASQPYRAAMQCRIENDTPFQDDLIDITSDSTESHALREKYNPTRQIPILVKNFSAEISRGRCSGFKFLRKMVSLLFLLSFMIPLQASAAPHTQDTSIHPNDNIDGIIQLAKTRFHQASLQNEFLPVGKIGPCTGTWIGDERDWSYILTAAQCMNYSNTVTPVNRTFTSWDGRVIAEGEGVAYISETTAAIPHDKVDSRNDICILKLPTVSTLVDKEGTPLQKPILYDGNDEVGKDTSFVGYGVFGSGLDKNPSYTPASNRSRLWGQSVTSGAIYGGRSLEANYHPAGDSVDSLVFWVAAATEDSGSVWWQKHKGKPVIVAVSSGLTPDYKVRGHRVSRNKDWIQTIYADASFLSTEFLEWGNNGRKGVVGDLYQYENPLKNQWEIYKLIKLNEGDTYDNFPLESRANRNWSYVGPSPWGLDGVPGFIFERPNDDESIDLFKLINRSSDNTYGSFPEGRGSNTWWSFIKRSSESNYASVKVGFAMTECKLNRRCGKAKISLDAKAYEKLGAPSSASFTYAKIHDLEKYSATGFTYDNHYDTYWIEKTDFTKKTPVNQGYDFGLEKVCLTNAKGHPISCADWGPDFGVNQKELLFPAPPNDGTTILVTVTVREIKKGENSHMQAKVSMTSKYYDLLSPAGVSYKYHRRKDSDPVNVTFSSDSNGGYFAEKTDEDRTVLAASRYAFNLHKVCIQSSETELCHRADMTDLSYKGGYQTQILHFPRR